MNSKVTTPSTFTSLPLNTLLLANLQSLDYDSMTSIQADSLPIMLAGDDVIGQAKTGSGKTAAFGLSILNQLNVKHYAIQSLILCPTRELAEQVGQAIRQLARQLHNVKVLNLSGGMPMRVQLDSLRHGAHIIVGTPGRVQKHINQQSLSLTHLKNLVLDEADRMLDMGFYEDIERIIQSCPSRRQTLLFSATYPTEIKNIARNFMKKPKHIISQESDTHADIEQIFYEVSDLNDKLNVLKKLLLTHQPTSALVFCNTKEQVKMLVRELKKTGANAMALHGDMEQIDRDIAMIHFANQSCPILVATDVAARGLDIKALPAVINYDLAFEPEVHTHRIGRTGRAGAKGLAISIISPSDAGRVIALEKISSTPVTWGKYDELNPEQDTYYSPNVSTLCLSAGRKDKIRPGDILGALTKDAGIAGDAIGKIHITPLYSYVAINQSHIQQAYQHFQVGKLKGRKVPVRR